MRSVKNSPGSVEAGEFFIIRIPTQTAPTPDHFFQNMVVRKVFRTIQHAPRERSLVLGRARGKNLWIQVDNVYMTLVKSDKLGDIFIRGGRYAWRGKR